MFEIGTSLREARERRRVDLAQAEQVTKIRAKYLRALEDEQFDLLPSQTYVKGFLRSYAEFLGLDGQLYVDEYASRFAVDDDYRPRRSSVRPQQRNRRLETNVVLVVLALIAIGTIVVISAWKTAGTDDQVPRVRSTAAPVAKPRTVPPMLSISALRGSSQLAVHQGSASGRLRYEGTLMRGQTAVFRGAKRFWLNVASPENVQVKVRGKAVKVKGKRPRVVNVTPTGIRPVS
jgi:hypothetical protein